MLIWQGFAGEIVLEYEGKVHHTSMGFYNRFLQLHKAQHFARVTRVKDGDTFILGYGSKAFTARLNNVDAPELKQNAGVSSYLYLNNKIIGKVVGL